jgi:N6-L-threonylcarbamoyladenine synthase
MSLPYPGGPVIDKLAKEGNAHAFTFAKPRIPDLGFSFSGLKTSFLYFLRDEIAKDPDFIEKEKNNLCASLQNTIIEILSEKILKAVNNTGIKTITLSGGVSANSGLRAHLTKLAEDNGLDMFLPEIRFTTDNAAMIGIAGYFKYLNKDFADLSIIPDADLRI